MNLNQINPYVRFARIYDKPIKNKKIVALDHRAFYCISGKATIKVGNKEYGLSQGAFVFWQSGIPYRNLSKESDAVFIGINFDLVASEDYPKMPVSYIPYNAYGKQMLIEKAIDKSFPKIPLSVHLPYFRYENKFREIFKEYTEKQPYFEERCSSLMKDIVMLALRESNVYNTRKSLDKADSVLAYVNEHYTEKLTNEAIGKVFSYHPNYVSNLVKMRTGKPLHKYLLQYRINMAILYLQSGEYNVNETANLVGFADAKHFSKCFTLITGSSPSAYRLSDF